jgi:hypothetical protein
MDWLKEARTATYTVPGCAMVTGRSCALPPRCLPVTDVVNTATAAPIGIAAAPQPQPLGDTVAKGVDVQHRNSVRPSSRSRAQQ